MILNTDSWEDCAALDSASASNPILEPRSPPPNSRRIRAHPPRSLRIVWLRIQNGRRRESEQRFSSEDRFFSVHMDERPGSKKQLLRRRRSMHTVTSNLTLRHLIVLAFRLKSSLSKLSGTRCSVVITGHNCYLPLWIPVSPRFVVFLSAKIAE